MGFKSQKALLFYDVFRGQTTDRFLDAPKENNVIATKVPPNISYLFQLLNLTVKKFAKNFTKQKLVGGVSGPSRKYVRREGGEGGYIHCFGDLIVLLKCVQGGKWVRYLTYLRVLTLWMAP